jgi:hypothetical protein
LLPQTITNYFPTDATTLQQLTSRWRAEHEAKNIRTITISLFVPIAFMFLIVVAWFSRRHWWRPSWQ